MQKYIKIAKGLFARARKKRVERPLLFWYMLKAHIEHGCITNVRQQLRSATDYSDSSNTRLLRACVDLGWIERRGDRYYLISYDRLFAWFSYDLKWNKRSRRKGSFLIFKIHTAYLNVLKTRIAFCEVRRNLKEQKKAIRNAAPKNTARKFSVENRIAIHKALMYEDDKIAQNILRDNNDVTLSCTGISELLGYTSPAYGCNLQKQMVEQQWITSTNRRLYVGAYLGQKLQYAQYIEDGIVYHQLPNLIGIVA